MPLTFDVAGCETVPKGHPRVARRFNAGLGLVRRFVPKGRLTGKLRRPFGTRISATGFPALKRRAIFGHPSWIIGQKVSGIGFEIRDTADWRSALRQTSNISLRF